MVIIEETNTKADLNEALVHVTNALQTSEHRDQLLIMIDTLLDALADRPAATS